MVAMGAVFVGVARLMQPKVTPLAHGDLRMYVNTLGSGEGIMSGVVQLRYMHSRIIIKNHESS